MNSKMIFFGLTSLILIACTPAEVTPDVGATQTSVAINSDIATVIFETQAASVTATQDAAPKTPTPTNLSFGELMLTGAELNELIEMWPDEPTLLDASFYENVCIGECYAREWTSLDGLSRIRIALYSFSSRELSYTRTVDYRNAISEPELPLPDISILSDDAWISDRVELGDGYALHAREGKVFAVVTIFMPNMELDQNLLFLTLYAERQMEKIDKAGY